MLGEVNERAILSKTTIHIEVACALIIEHS